MSTRAILLILFAHLSSSALCQQSLPKADTVSVPQVVSQAILASNDPKDVASKVVSSKETHEKGLSLKQGPVEVSDRSTLLSAWDRIRSGLNDKGIELSLTYRFDGLSNLAGGQTRAGAHMVNVDVSSTMKGDKLLGWTNSTLFIHIISNNGGDFHSSVGDAQMVSNIEAPKLTKLYEAWIQQSALDGSLSFLGGLYDLNSEFYVTNASGLFLNGSHGIGKELSQTGKNGPSIFPNTAPGFRIKAEPMEHYYFEVVALDAVPGDADDPSASSFHLSSDEGALLVAELGFWKEGSESDAACAKLALGVWQYTAPFEGLLTDDAVGHVQSRANRGVYLLAEKKVLKGSASDSRGLALFARMGVANGRINSYDYHLGFGAVYTGLFEGREDDMFGVAVAHAHCSGEFQKLMLEQGSFVRSGEVAIELTYRAQLTPWLALQPDLQHIIRPSGDVAIQDATTFGARFELKL
jgi:porin